ncbi:MAG: 3-oxoacyl-ACP synthase III [Planctomycetota bacterium]
MPSFDQVVLAGIATILPPIEVTSAELEDRLSPVYQRLKLPPGRLQLMSGIEARRLWNPGTRPSGPSIQAITGLLDRVDLDPKRVGCLVHGSVCRDFLEPATASKVHHGAGLPSDCWVYDVSNACLGILNGMIQVASAIQCGLIEAGVVVGTENSRPLMEQTIMSLNEDHTLTRQSIKPAFASLTIGSGCAAMLLARRDRFPTATRFNQVVAHANTEFHDLCVSDEDAGASMSPLMETDSEELMKRGIETGVAAFQKLNLTQEDEFDVTVCHQVGVRHRAAMLEAMELPLKRDYVAYDRLGNTGSAALPTALTLAAAEGFVQPQQRVGLLGIGSGINSVMVDLNWGETAAGVIAMPAS